MADSSCRGRRVKGGGRPAGRRGVTRGVTLLNLVEAGILEPGEGVVTHFYHGNTDVADLSARGELLWEGRVFESPSAFSIAVKRRVNPGRKADDGWKSVKVRGRLLEEYKKTYLLTVVAPSIKAGLRVPGTQGGKERHRKRGRGQNGCAQHHGPPIASALAPPRRCPPIPSRVARPQTGRHHRVVEKGFDRQNLSGEGMSRMAKT